MARAIAVTEDRTLAVVDREVPDPGPGQVVVDVAYCGICGSDFHVRDSPQFPAGAVPGHEFTGRIGALGAGVDGWSVGDRVAVLPFGQCGECEICRAGQEQVCPHALPNAIGLAPTRPGAYAERVLVDAPMLFAVPDALSDEAAALVEPLAVAVHAVAKGAPAPGAPVAVIGAGPIGLLTALVLRAYGHDELVVVSRNPARAAVAEGLGLRTAAPDDELGLRPAVVFECAGPAPAAALALSLVPPLGRVVLVGFAFEPLALPGPEIVIKEAEIVGAVIYRRRDFAEAIELLVSGRVPSAGVVSEVVDLARAEEMFGALRSPGNALVKVLLKP